MNPAMMQPQIILLREGTDTSQGRGQIISNINACLAVVDIISSTLGPRGMDKLIYDDRGKSTISNDGATIMGLLEIVHPAARALKDISMSQDAEVGDGTTSVVVITGEILREAKTLIEEGMHVSTIVAGYRSSLMLARKHLKELSTSLEGKDEDERRDLLTKCATTALNSKLIAGQRDFFGKMAVDAVSCLDQNNLDVKLIGIKKVQGGSLQDSMLVKGVAFKKTFSYAGFEQQPKNFKNPKILLLNVELELKSEKENAEVRIKDPDQYQEIVDAEWKIIYDKLDKIVATGAKVVLSRLAIGDLATQYFADRDIFCAGRVPEDDLQRTYKATGGMVQTSVNKLVPEIMGECGAFEEKQVGGERYNFFTECPNSQTATIVLRGGAEQFIEEAHRSLHDSMMIVIRASQHSSVVAGGGAIEMELSKLLRAHARTIEGRSQLVVNAFAKALEVIPRTIAQNAGFDSTDILNSLRQKHASGSKNYGVDIVTQGVCDTHESFVWEPSLIKQQALSAAVEAACLVLSIDETVRNPQSEKPQAGPPMGQMMGRGRGRGMRGLGRTRMMRGRSGK